MTAMRTPRAPTFRRLLAVIRCKLHLAVLRAEIYDMRVSMDLAEGRGDFDAYRNFYRQHTALVAEQIQTRNELAHLTHRVA